jgi:hypothetical protein
LTVRKIVNNYGGDAIPSDFTIEVTGTDVSLDGGVTTAASVQFPGDELGTVVTLGDGEFGVMEIDGSGYEVTYDAGCGGVAVSGSEFSCTINNTEIIREPVDGSLTVRVLVDGAAAPANFNVFLNGNNAIEIPWDSAIVLPPGDYTLFEEALTGYEATFSGDCTGTSAFNGAGNIASDEDVTCTINNTFVGGPSGGGSSGSGSSGSNDPSGGDGDNDPTPPGDVLGDTDEEEAAPIDEEDEVVIVTPPSPIVAGVSDELPRTGVPIAGVLALGSVLTFLVRRKEQE